MMDEVCVRILDGRAEVRFADRVLEVERRDQDSRAYTCPLELVAAALGS